MTVPKVSDFPQYTNTAITGNNWNQLIQDIVDLVTNGQYDFNVRQLTAQYLFGDISGCTGFPSSDFTVLAGEAITAGQYIRISSSSAFVASQASDSGITNLSGFAVNSAALSEPVTIRSVGIYSGLSGLSAGTVYYLSTAGTLTSSKPSSRAVPLCIAISSTTVLLNKFGEINTTFPGLNTTGTITGISTDATAYDLIYRNLHATGLTRLIIEGNVTGLNAQVVADPANNKVYFGSSSSSSNFYEIFTGSVGPHLWKINGLELMRLNNNSFIIGTNSTGATNKFSVEQGSSTNGATAVRGNVTLNGNNTSGFGAYFSATTNGTPDGQTIYAGYFDAFNGGGATNLTTYGLYSNRGNVVLNASSGNTGIGTNSPGYKLDVNGTSHFTGAALFDYTATFNGTYLAANQFLVSSVPHSDVSARFNGNDNFLLSGSIGAPVYSTMELTPTITSSGAYTLTDYSYMKIGQMTISSGAVTNKYLMYFNAALGTHVATTNSDKTGNAKSGTLKINVNGTLYHIQLYANV